MLNIFIILSVVSLSSSLIKKPTLFCSAVNLQGALQTQIRVIQGSTLRRDKCKMKHLKAVQESEDMEMTYAQRRGVL